MKQNQGSTDSQSNGKAIDSKKVYSWNNGKFIFDRCRYVQEIIDPSYFLRWNGGVIIVMFRIFEIILLQEAMHSKPARSCNRQHGKARVESLSPFLGIYP
ncbi:hypothetical protein HUB94_09440 [Paenibacillus cellulosilyticus]|nr:hypothetical protein HUB94_09440 [Paenibacillus cellulosilyticus]